MAMAHKELEAMHNGESKQSKLSLKRILAFASTDTAGNLLYCTLTSYIMYFYTDVLGISVAAAGMILLVARIVDALDAPIWGIVIDLRVLDGDKVVLTGYGSPYRLEFSFSWLF